MGQGPRSEPLPGGSREDMAFFGWTAWTSDLHKGSLSPLSPPAEHQRVASISFWELLLEFYNREGTNNLLALEKNASKSNKACK